MSNRFKSKWNAAPLSMVRPSRWVARNTNGRGQSAKPLGPLSIADGSNIRA